MKTADSTSIQPAGTVSSPVGGVAPRMVPVKRKRGRQPEINQKKVTVIIAAVRNGTPRMQAALIAGISYESYANWMRRGEAAFVAAREDVDNVKLEDRLYVNLFQGVNDAISRTIDEAVANVRKAGKKNWQASAWLLTRLCPNKFADNRQELAALKKQFTELSKQLAEMQLKRAPSESSPEPQLPFTPNPVVPMSNVVLADPAQPLKLVEET